MGEKRRIVEQTLQPGTSVAVVALSNGVNANQVFGRRRKYRQALPSQMAAEPVKLLPARVRRRLTKRIDPVVNKPGQQ